MAAGIKEVRDRIGSISNTKKITEAMKLVAAAKVRRAQEAVVNGRPFAENLVKVRGWGPPSFCCCCVPPHDQLTGSGRAAGWSGADRCMGPLGHGFEGVVGSYAAGRGEQLA